MARPSLRCASLLLALVPLACAPTSAPDAGPDEDAGATDSRLRVGTGFERFEPLADGDDVTFTAGFQGGHHVWGALRVEDLEPVGAELAFSLEVQGEVVASMGFSTDLWASEEEPDAFELYGVTVILGGEHDPYALDGSDGVLRARVEDTAGVTRARAIPVKLRCCDDPFGGGGVGNGLDGGVPVPGDGRGPGAPLIHGVVVDRDLVLMGEEVSVAVLASDPDGDALSTSWRATAGTFAAPGVDVTTWTAPAEAGTYVLEVEVSDGAQRRAAAKTVEVQSGG